MTTGKWNTLVGALAGNAITDGTYNVLMGYDAGTGLVSGSGNIIMGQSAAGALTADNNVYIGRRVAQTATTGDANVCIGDVADVSAATVSNEVNIYNGSVTARFQGAAAAWSFVSDERDKKEIKDLELGVDFVNKLKPRKFKWDLRNSDVDKDKEASGFVAQEIQEVLDQTDTNYTELVDTNNPDQYTVAQSNLVPILVKAVQELSAEVKQLKQQLNN
jgi:hypothetical protein